MAKGKDFISCKDVLWYMIFTGCAINYMTKISLNLVIVAMVIPRSTKLASSQCMILENTTNVWSNVTATTDVSELMTSSTNVPETITYEDKFDWSEYEQSLVLGAFYWSYWITQVPGGLLGQRYGAKRIFGGGNFLASLIGLLLPLAMKYHLIGLIILRCIQGLIMGGMYPSMHGLCAHWVPPNKRSKFVNAYLGGSVGTAITYPLCATIIYYFNWETAFYVTSLFGFIWFGFWCLLVYDTPQQHPRISQEELEYIIKNTPPSVGEPRKRTVPWKSIFTSGPLWITIAAHWGATWGFYTLLSQTPSYFNYIHGWSINMTGVLSGAPHLALMAFAYFLSSWTDRILKLKKMSRTAVRKITTIVLTGGQAIMIIGLSFSGCKPILAVVFMIFGTAMNGAMPSSTIANLVDLSPNYASILLGITGLVVNAAGYLSPMIVGVLTNNNQTIGQWRFVFLIAAGNLIVGCIAYIIWGTSEEQPWNHIGTGDTELGEELEKLKARPDNTDDNGKIIDTKNEKSPTIEKYEWKDTNTKSKA